MDKITFPRRVAGISYSLEMRLGLCMPSPSVSGVGGFLPGRVGGGLQVLWMGWSKQHPSHPWTGPSTAKNTGPTLNTYCAQELLTGL